MEFFHHQVAILYFFLFYPWFTMINAKFEVIDYFSHYSKILDCDRWPVWLGSLKLGSSSGSYFLGLFSWADTCRHPYSKVQRSLSPAYIPNSYEHINNTCSSGSDKVSVFILCRTSTYRINIRRSYYAYFFKSLILLIGNISYKICIKILGWNFIIGF